MKTPQVPALDGMTPLGLNPNTMTTNPAMNTNMNMIPVLDEHCLTAHQRRYWCGPNFQRRATTQGVALIDPWRTHLRILRRNPEYIGKKVYRASTGGAWGKSSAIVRL